MQMRKISCNYTELNVNASTYSVEHFHFGVLQRVYRSVNLSVAPKNFIFFDFHMFSNFYGLFLSFIHIVIFLYFSKHYYFYLELLLNYYF